MAEPLVRNRLPAVLAACGMGWGDLGRRARLAPGVVRRLQTTHANPRLAVAERVAAALDLPVEALWTLRRGAPR
ncbi:MAG: hypothetical protein U0807_07105 [Candidatus Binatia bacterium]